MSLEILLRRNASTVNSTSSALSSTSRVSTSCDIDPPWLIATFGLLLVLFPDDPTVKKNVAPSSTFASAQILPPCLRIMRCTIARPTPVPQNPAPCATAEKLRRACLSKPAPLSRTKITRWSFLLCLSHFNHGMLPLPRVLHRIRQQIYEYLFH